MQCIRQWCTFQKAQQETKNISIMSQLVMSNRYSKSYLIIIVSIRFRGNTHTHVIINSVPTRNFHKRVGIDERVHDNENIYEEWPKLFLKGWIIVEDNQINVLKKQQNYFETCFKRCTYLLHTLKIILKSKLICMAFGKKFRKKMTHQQIVWGNGPKNVRTVNRIWTVRV